MRMRKLWVAAIVALAGSNAEAADWSGLDCAQSWFLKAAMEDINKSQDRNHYKHVIDIKNVDTIQSISSELICHMTLVFTDNTNQNITLTVHDNSFGLAI